MASDLHGILPRDENRHPVPVLPWVTCGGVGAAKTQVRTFNAASQNVQLGPIPLPTGATTRTGWFVSFTASEDCYIAIGGAAVTAAAATAGSMFLARGAIFGPIDMNDSDYVAAIRHTTDGCLYVNYHAYRKE